MFHRFDIHYDAQSVIFTLVCLPLLFDFRLTGNFIIRAIDVDYGWMMYVCFDELSF